MPSVAPRLSPLSDNQKTQPFTLPLPLCVSLSQSHTCPAPITFPRTPASRCIREKESTGTGGRGQQLWIWKNNSCDSHIVIPTFVSCRVRQQVSSQRENRRAHPHTHWSATSSQKNKKNKKKQRVWRLSLPCLWSFASTVQLCISELREISLHTCWIPSERRRANYEQATALFWSQCISQIMEKWQTPMDMITRSTVWFWDKRATWRELNSA